MLKQIRKLRSGAADIVNQYEGQKPRTLGRIYQAVGGLLVADGIFGLKNPLNRSSSRVGIFGSLILMAVGVAVLLGAFWIIKLPKVDSMVIGHVSYVSAPKITKDEKGQEESGQTCTYKAKYVVGEKEYQVDSGFGSSGACKRMIGETVEVHYLASRPNAGVLSPNTQKYLRWGGIAIGLILMAAGFVTFVIRSVTIFLGVKLFFRGRKLVKDSPEVEGDDGVVSAAKDAFMKMRFG